MKRVLLILSPLLLVILVIAGVLRYLHPQIEQFLTTELRILSHRFTPVEISAEHVDLHLFPPSVELNSVQIAAKDPQAFGFSVIDIDSTEASLDFLQLLGGRLGVSTLTVDGIDAEINLDAIKSESDKPIKGINLGPLFDEMKFLPVHRLSLTNLEAKIFSKKLNFTVTLGESNALLVNTGDSIVLESEFDSEEYQYGKISDSAHLRLGLVLRKNQVEIPQFHLTTMSTDILLNATLFNLDDFKNNLTLRAEVNSSSDLSALSEKLQQEFKIPLLEGHLRLKTQFDLEKSSLRLGSIETSGENIKVAISQPRPGSDKDKIEKIDIGKVEMSGIWKNDQFKAKTFQVTNEATVLDLPGFEVNLNWQESKPQLSFKTRLETELLDLNQLLQNVTAGKIPIELLASGGLQCGGPLYPSLSVTCQGEAHSDLFEARSSYEDKNIIVALGEASINGTVSVDKERVQYQAELKIGDNIGHSEGRIGFADGFDISYDSPEVDFKNLDHLVNLKLEGQAKLAGRITGDKSHAEFFIDAEGQDIWFEDFFLGHPKLTVRYKSGVLNFEHIVSNINSSRMQAEVQLNLNDKQIAIEGQSQGLDLSDALLAFQRKVTLPVEVSGNGDIKVKASGPLDFSHLSYDFSAELQKSMAAGENIDSAIFKVKSNKGEVKITELTLHKGQGLITGEGLAHPDGTAQVSLATQGMVIEESENVARLSPNISGLWSANLHLNGRILSPTVQLDTEVKNLVIEDQEFPGSQAQLLLNTHSISGSANFFEGKLISHFVLPMSEQDPFKFEASARDWNYTTVLSLLGGGALLSEYQASLTGDINLHADKGGFFASSGDGSILRLELQRKNLRLVNPGPMELKMDKGQLSLKNFRLSGEDSYLEVSSTASSRNNLNMKAKGNIQLHVLQIFFPFLDDLSGIANVQSSISGKLEKPEILGNASLTNAFVKLKSLPHTFEHVSAQAQFSQNRVLVSNINGGFAGGTITGEGTISIVGPRDLPLVFKGQFEGVTLNIPDGIRSSGFGDVAISGNWFPFMLAGTYHVTGGLISKEFTDTSDIQGSKQSTYLPRILLQNAFEPINLNMQIIMDQPIGMKDSLMDGTLTGTVTVQGLPSSAILGGKVNIEHGSKIYFKDKSFDVGSGLINFNNSREINPELYITGQSHVSEYDVNLTVQGTAKNPIIRLNSSPPLPQQDIVSLLALGMTSGSLDDNGGLQKRDSQAAATQAIAAGISEISKGAQKALDVNVQVSSEYDDTKNMAIQKYTISRKVSDKVMLYGTQTTGDLVSRNVQLKYNLNTNYSLSTSYEDIESAQSGFSNNTEPSVQFFGIDLQFKQEFK